MRFVAMTVLLLVIPVLSQPPSPTKAKRHQQPQNAAADEPSHADNPRDFPVAIGSQTVTLKRSESEGQKQQESSSNWWLVGFNGGLLVVAGIQLWIVKSQRNIMQMQSATMFLQYVAMMSSVQMAQEANAINREALQAGQRAYIAFPLDPLQIVTRVDVAGNIIDRKIRLAVQNTGNTPARELINRVNFWWTPGNGGLPDDFAFPDQGEEIKFPSPLAAKSGTYSPELTIADSVVRQALNAEARLFFYGYGTYRDVFVGTPQHLTEFCHELKILEIAGEAMKCQLVSHQKHNTQT